MAEIKPTVEDFVAAGLDKGLSIPQIESRFQELTGRKLDKGLQFASMDDLIAVKLPSWMETTTTTHEGSAPAPKYSQAELDAARLGGMSVKSSTSTDKPTLGEYLKSAPGRALARSTGALAGLGDVAGELGNLAYEQALSHLGLDSDYKYMPSQRLVDTGTQEVIQDVDAGAEWKSHKLDTPVIKSIQGIQQLRQERKIPDGAGFWETATILASNTGQSAADIVKGLVSIPIELSGINPTKEELDALKSIPHGFSAKSVDKGREFGGQLAAGVVTVPATIATNPVEALETDAVGTALTVLPLASPAAHYVGRIPGVAEVAEVAAKVRDKVPAAREVPILRKIPEWFGNPADVANPEYKRFLQDVLTSDADTSIKSVAETLLHRDKTEKRTAIHTKSSLTPEEAVVNPYTEVEGLAVPVPQSTMVRDTVDAITPDMLLDNGAQLNRVLDGLKGIGVKATQLEPVDMAKIFEAAKANPSFDSTAADIAHAFGMESTTKAKVLDRLRDALISKGDAYSTDSVAPGKSSTYVGTALLESPSFRRKVADSFVSSLEEGAGRRLPNGTRQYIAEMMRDVYDGKVKYTTLPSELVALIEATSLLDEQYRVEGRNRQARREVDDFNSAERERFITDDIASRQRLADYRDNVYGLDETLGRLRDELSRIEAARESVYRLLDEFEENPEAAADRVRGAIPGILDEDIPDYIDALADEVDRQADAADAAVADRMQYLDDRHSRFAPDTSVRPIEERAYPVDEVVSPSVVRDNTLAAIEAALRSGKGETRKTTIKPQFSPAIEGHISDILRGSTASDIAKFEREAITNIAKDKTHTTPSEEIRKAIEAYSTRNKGGPPIIINEGRQAYLKERPYSGISIKDYVSINPVTAKYYGLSPEAILPKEIALSLDMHAGMKSNVTGLLNNALKSGLTAGKIPSLINNIASNMIYQAIRTGDLTLPFGVIQEALEFKRHRKEGLNPKNPTVKQRAFLQMEVNGLLDTSVIDADLRPSVLDNLGLGPIRPIKNIKDVYRASDSWFKVDEAVRQFEYFDKLYQAMSPGETLQLDIGNRKVTITKRDNPSPQYKAKVDKAMGLAAKKIASDIFFDYGDIPNALKWLKSVPLVNIASPFYTFAFKSVFERPFRDTSSVPWVKTTSPAVRQIMIQDRLNLFERRMAALGAIKGSYLSEKTDLDLAKKFAYIPRDETVAFLQDVTSPLVVPIKDATQWNAYAPITKAARILSWFGDELRASMGATDEYDVKKSVKPVATMSDVLDTIGLSGGILIGIMNKINSLGETGVSEGDVLAELLSSITGTVGDATVAGLNLSGLASVGGKYARTLDENSLAYLTRILTGLGWRDAVLAKKVGWYTSEMERRIKDDVLGRKRIKELSMKQQASRLTPVEADELDGLTESSKRLGPVVDKAMEDILNEYNEALVKLGKKKGDKHNGNN